MAYIKRQQLHLVSDALSDAGAGITGIKNYQITNKGDTMYQVTYTDVNTGEALTLMMKLYQVNNESQLPPEKENRYRTFCTGRIINRTVTEVTDQ